MSEMRAWRTQPWVWIIAALILAAVVYYVILAFWPA